MKKVKNTIRNFNAVQDLMYHAHINNLSFIHVYIDYETGYEYQVIQPINFVKLDYKFDFSSNEDEINLDQTMHSFDYYNIVGKLDKDIQEQFNTTKWLCNGHLNKMMYDLSADYYLFFDSVEEFEKVNNELIQTQKEINAANIKFTNLLQAEDDDKNY